MTTLSINELKEFIQTARHERHASPRTEWNSLRQPVIDSLNAQIPSINKKKYQVMPQDGRNTVQVVHYTSLSTLVSILKSAQSTDNHGYLRMYSSTRSNDPDEGQYLFQQCQPTVAIPEPSYAYLASFIEPDDRSNPELAANNLIFWRTYGQDGRGCSLTVTLAPEELRRVQYGRKAAYDACKEIRAALDSINKIIQCVHDIDNPQGTEEIETWKNSVLLAQIQAIAYLYKSDAYQYENECRIVRLPKEPQANNSQIEFIGHPLRGTTTSYLEIPALSTDPGNGMFRTGSVITLGPLVPNPIHTKRDILELLHRANLYGPQVQLSKINYKGNPD